MLSHLSKFAFCSRAETEHVIATIFSARAETHHIIRPLLVFHFTSGSCFILHLYLSIVGGGFIIKNGRLYTRGRIIRLDGLGQTFVNRPAGYSSPA